jgi:hypothetical protein
MSFSQTFAGNQIVSPAARSSVQKLRQAGGGIGVGAVTFVCRNIRLALPPPAMVFFRAGSSEVSVA